jgi:serine/threonine-protein kinase
MTIDRWQQISALYHGALTRPRDERSAYLHEACAGDESLKREVEALLAADGEAALVDTPALEAAARSKGYQKRGGEHRRHSRKPRWLRR